MVVAWSCPVVGSAGVVHPASTMLAAIVVATVSAARRRVRKVGSMDVLRVRMMVCATDR